MHASHKDKEFYSHVCVTEYQNNNTGCLLISVACLGIHNLMIFWS